MGLKHLSTENEYEVAHFSDIQNRMKSGSVVYDIGSYDGITSALIAQTVGPENVVIIEPAETNWATIQAYWRAHGFANPKATYAGFLCDSNDSSRDLRSLVTIGDFPPEAKQFPISQLEEVTRFRSFESNTEHRPSMTLDSMSEIVGHPSGITMDVEGAEFLVLQGSRTTLQQHHPTVWISVHPKFMLERFYTDPKELHEYMSAFGYVATLLANDHEEHWRFDYV